MASAAAGRARKQTKAYDTPEELELVRRAKAGDESAFTQLYQTHHNRIRITINRIVQNEDIADWLANIALTKVWQNLPKFAGQAKFSTWVTKIAINAALMHKRKENTLLHKHECSLDEVLSDSTPGNIVSRRLMVRDLNLEGVADRQVLEVAISRVPVEYRQILRLRFWEGRSLEYILGVLAPSSPNLQLAALKSRLLRGRKILIQQVEANSTLN